jgi:hypothetical protein
MKWPEEVKELAPPINLKTEYIETYDGVLNRNVKVPILKALQSNPLISRR